MNTAEMDAVARVLVTPQRLPNPALVGKAATYIADKCGITVPAETRLLIAPLRGDGQPLLKKLGTALLVTPCARGDCQAA